MQGFTQWPTYPQLLVNGELLGGCDIIMEMQQDGSLKSAVQEALGMNLDTKTAVQQRIKQLLDSKPVMLFMKVSSFANCSSAMWPSQFALSSGRTQRLLVPSTQSALSAMPMRCMQAEPVAGPHQ